MKKHKFKMKVNLIVINEFKYINYCIKNKIYMVFIKWIIILY